MPAFGPPFAVAYALTYWSSAASDVAVLVLGLWSVWWYSRERPLGKRLVGLTAYGETGGRRLLRGTWSYLVVPSFAWWWLAPLLLADAIATLVDRERRALHDLAAGTIVLEPRSEPDDLVRLRLLPPELRARVAAEAFERAGVRPQRVETPEDAYRAFQLPLDLLYERSEELELTPEEKHELAVREQSLAAAEAEARSLHSPP